MTKIKNKIIFIIIIFISGCLNNKKEDLESSIAAYVNNVPIKYIDIDKLAKQEIYDELNRIYLIRKLVLDEKIENELLNQEAKKNNVSYEKLIDNYYKRNINDSSIKIFIQINGYQQFIPEYTNTLKYHDINSTKGRKVLIKKFKNYLINKYVDSLKKENRIKIFLKPPLPPSPSFLVILQQPLYITDI